MEHDPEARESPGATAKAVREWNARKRRLFKTEHVLKAWDRIAEKGWVPGESMV